MVPGSDIFVSVQTHLGTDCRLSRRPPGFL